MPLEGTEQQPVIQQAWAKELQRYSFAELQHLLGLRDEERGVQAVQQLRDAKLLRILRRGEVPPPDSVEGAEESDACNIRHPERYDYSFRCVGLLQFGKRALYILPKYCDKQEEAETAESRLETFRTVLRVIERYRRNARSIGDEPNEEEWHDFLHIMVELVTDYAENGVYRVDEEINEVNGRGRIVWPRTIRRVLPLIQDERPVYTDVHTRRKRADESYFITRLHRYLARQAWQHLEQLRLTELLGIPDVIEDTNHEEEFSDTEHLILCLRREQTLRFDNRRRYLLELMLRYLAAQEEEARGGMYLYGKSDFHVVWEEACRKAFGMEASQRAEMAASVPRWKTSSGRTTLGTELKADMFCYRDGALLIGDAKYYIPRVEDFSGGTTSGMPGIGDIIKQQLYELALRRHYHPTRETRNVFLMPLLDSEKSGITGLLTDFGRVDIPMLTDGEDSPHLRPIHLCKVDPVKLWNAYLHRDSLFNELYAALGEQA